MKALRVLSAALSILLLATGCSTSATGGGTGKLNVVVAFYPLQYVVEQVGGDQVSVTSLTKPGVEPHDLELTAKQVASVAFADLVFYEKGFQSAVDSAVDTEKPKRVVDAATIVPLRTTPGFTGEAATPSMSALDPHTWLDPQTMIEYASAVAEQLSQARPDASAAFQQRADALVKQLTTLDGEFSTGLASCKLKVFVTSHAAFGYLAERYGLEQVGIAGLSPDAEPTPSRLAEVQKIAKEKGVTTIFSETLASPALANALAKDLGLKTDVLDPLEGITSQSRGTDYPSVMRSNLSALRTAGGCQ
ncbi:MAG TPA: metal ABC transporter substrate-binding protein [Propionibacteriaceae bacterium]|jgi:zinc transport system substrate-binding protein